MYLCVLIHSQCRCVRLLFAMGKTRGTPCTRRHIVVHRATGKYFSSSFVFKSEIEREGLPRDNPAGLGAGGLEFKSPRPDHLLFRFQFTFGGRWLHRGLNFGSFGSQHEALHVFHDATLLFRYRVQLNLARDVRRRIAKERLVPGFRVR
jgi:hypothetical protein